MTTASVLIHARGNRAATQGALLGPKDLEEHLPAFPTRTRALPRAGSGL